MALRYKDSLYLNYSGALQIPGAIPLDIRAVVPSLTDLKDVNTWKGVAGNVAKGTAYTGMLVAVEDTCDLYMCTDPSKISTDAGWKFVGGVTPTELLDIKNHLTYLDSSISDISTRVSTLETTITQKFTYEIVDELPVASESTMYKLYLVRTNDPSLKGQDFYNEFITVRTGTEGSYVYTFERIGDTHIDLSAYAKIDDVNSSLASLKTYIDTSIENLEASIYDVVDSSFVKVLNSVGLTDGLNVSWGDSGIPDGTTIVDAVKDLHSTVVDGVVTSVKMSSDSSFVNVMPVDASKGNVELKVNLDIVNSLSDTADSGLVTKNYILEMFTWIEEIN